MAIKTLRILDLFETTYNDAIASDAINTDGVVKVTRAPSGNDEVLRYQDGTLVLTIGGGVGGGTAKSVLFIDNSGNLGQDNPDLTYDESLNLLTIPNINHYGQSRINLIGIDDTDSPYSVAGDEWYIIADTSAGAVTVNLPALGGTKRVIRVRNYGAAANKVTLTPNGSDTIEGSSSFILYDGENVDVLDFLTDWIVL